jgi:hypothetical protein
MREAGVEFYNRGVDWQAFEGDLGMLRLNLFLYPEGSGSYVRKFK